MNRNYRDWISAYVSLVSHTEAPKLVHFWAGIGALAGAMRRRVWIDHGTFKWYPSFYTIFVAPPEVISKSVSAGVAMSMLQEVPGIHFGPDSITWQSLVTSFAACSESFQIGDEWIPMSALTFFSSELGLLVDFQNRDMINVLIDFWDGRKSFKKETKMSGNDTVEAPFINILACTTPDWIATNLPQIAIGGGFTSRCVFVYADKKERLVAHPRLHLPADFSTKRAKLMQDLEYISTSLAGEFHFTSAAIAWEEAWYKHLWEVERQLATKDEIIALQRRHTHLNKLAMMLSISHSDSLTIDKEDFELADVMLRTTAENYYKVFANMNKGDTAQHAERFIDFIQKKGQVPYEEAYRMIHVQFPDFRDYEGVLNGAVRSGQLSILSTAKGVVLSAAKPPGGPAITPDTPV